MSTHRDSNLGPILFVSAETRVRELIHDVRRRLTELAGPGDDPLAMEMVMESVLEAILNHVQDFKAAYEYQRTTKDELMAVIRQQRTLQATVTDFLKDDKVSHKSFIEKHKQELNALHAQIVNLNIRVAKERTTSRNLETLYDDFETKLEQHTKEIDKLKVQNSNLVDERDKLRQQIQDLTIDKHKNGLKEMQRQINNLEVGERLAHECTQQSVDELQTLTKSVDKKIQVLIDQSKIQVPADQPKKKSFIHGRISKIKRKVKSMLQL